MSRPAMLQPPNHHSRPGKRVLGGLRVETEELQPPRDRGAQGEKAQDIGPTGS